MVKELKQFSKNEPDPPAKAGGVSGRVRMQGVGSADNIISQTALHPTPPVAGRVFGQQHYNQRKDKPPPRRGKPGIEKLPESTRKTILWLAAIILTITIFYFWLLYLPKTLTIQPEGADDEKLEELQENISDFLIKTQNQFGELKQGFSNLTEATPTPEINEKDINKLKEKLLKYPATTTTGKDTTTNEIFR